jgi:hypothetical protein
MHRLRVPKLFRIKALRGSIKNDAERKSDPKYGCNEADELQAEAAPNPATAFRMTLSIVGGMRVQEWDLMSCVKVARRARVASRIGGGRLQPLDGRHPTGNLTRERP